jgi:hypothetical protein
VVFAFLFARLGLLEARTTERAVVMSATIFLSGGIIGTLHHLYFTATPPVIMALGLVWSALEVVPLVFIGYEAWENLRLSRHQGWVQKYRYPIYFFVAVAFWNAVGAGVVLCRVMQVARSGFYAWQGRSPSKRACADKQLTGQITQAFAASRGTYGSPRVRVELHSSGIVASKRRVTQLMRRQGLYALRKRPFIHTTDSKHKLPIAPNLLARNFTAEAPNRVWVTDITCIWTLQGWLFLAVILDLFSRCIVG